MSVQDFTGTLPPAPDWLQKAWATAKLRQLDVPTLDEINAEIDAARREKDGDAR